MRPGWGVVESVSFFIPALPPSKNRLHSIIRYPNKALQFKRSTDYERWLTDTMPMIPMLKPLANSHYFMVDAVFEYPFLHPNGRHRRVDGHNFLEALCDAIASKNGFDDSYIKFGSWEVYDSDKEFISCKVSQVSKQGGE